MNREVGIVVTGVAPGSLGEALAIALCRRHPETKIVAIDLMANPALADFSNVYSLGLDLNPISPSQDCPKLATRIAAEIDLALQRFELKGIGAAILAAGVYESGPLVEITLEARQSLVGINVCGKLEVLHAVLEFNQRNGFASREALTFIDIGSLHGLTSSAGRPLYAATKAFGLDLCISMRRGGEVCRAIYAAPGQIDTPMLHRNHWVSKERGSPEFFKHVRSLGTVRYRDIFVECDDSAFREVVSTSGLEPRELNQTFSRYKLLRSQGFERADGILCPVELADHLVRILGDAAVHQEGVYMFSAPKRQLEMRHLSFNEVRPEIGVSVSSTG